MQKCNFKFSRAREYLLANADFIPDFSLLGLLHFLSFSDLSYNELEQLPPKAFYEIVLLEEL